MSVCTCMGKRRNPYCDAHHGYTRRPVRTEPTKAQRDELRKQLREPQPTFGSGRTRVQNNLVAAKLSEYVNDEGRPTKAKLIACAVFDWTDGFPHRCCITPAGRAALERTGLA